ERRAVRLARSRELHLNGTPLRVPRVEKLSAAEREQPRDQRVGHALHRIVVVADGAVVEAPRILQVLLDIDELALQLEEIPARVQVRIGFLQREDPRERLLERGFDLSEAGRTRLAQR